MSIANSRFLGKFTCETSVKYYEPIQIDHQKVHCQLNQNSGTSIDKVVSEHYHNDTLDQWQLIRCKIFSLV